MIDRVMVDVTKLERRLIRDEAARLMEHELNGKDLKEILSKFLAIIDEKGLPYQRMLFEMEAYRADRDEDDGSAEIVIYGERLENDQEYARRIEEELNQAARQENYDRGWYERLKKQFEPK